MKIPFMRLDRQFSSLRKQLEPRLFAVLESGRVLQSPDVERLETRLAELFRQKHAVVVNSGTDALIFSLVSLGLPAETKVAVTSMSFIASASAIVHSGCRPVFIDVDPDTMLMDTERLLALMRARKVDAIVGVHLYGQLIDLDEVSREAQKLGIPIIEDAAQALGATRAGKPPGAHAEATCLSFDPTKVLGAYGSGGAIVTDRDDLATHVRRLRYHGHVGKRVYELCGYNSQLDSVQAAVLDVKLDHVDAWQRRRADIAATYSERLAACRGVRCLKTLPENQHNHHKFVLHAERRAELIEHLSSAGVQTSVHYSTPLHRQPCFAPYADELSLPRVEQAAQTILSLPIYAELQDSEVSHITSVIADFYG